MSEKDDLRATVESQALEIGRLQDVLKAARSLGGTVTRSLPELEEILRAVKALRSECGSLRSIVSDQEELLIECRPFIKSYIKNRPNALMLEQAKDVVQRIDVLINSTCPAPASVQINTT